MMNARTVAMVVGGIVCLTRGVNGQSVSQYRNFALGSDMVSVSALAGIDPAEAKTIHQRPAVLQDLEWRLSRWVAGSNASSVDPVEQILFSFYNDQLFRVVVDYGHERTEGMTAADMIEGISSVYGAPLPRSSRLGGRAALQLETESGSLVAAGATANTESCSTKPLPTARRTA
jgi:hypothetical protein